MNPNEKIEKTLALILINQMKGVSQREKALQLNIAGFSNVEIADILQTTTAVISQSLYTVRKGTKKKAEQKEIIPPKEEIR